MLVMTITVGVFITVTGLLYVLAARLTAGGVARRRLEVAVRGAPQASGLEILGEAAPNVAGLRIVEALGRIARGAERNDDAPRESLLIHAGFRRPYAPAIYTGLRLALALGLPAVVIVGGVALADRLVLVPLAIVAAAFGWLLPALLVRRIAVRRQREMTRALPDLLDLLVLCVEAGLGLNAALTQVAQERSGQRDAASEELHITARELQLGIARKDAFRNLADRTGVPELKPVVAQLIQADRLGTSIGQALRAQSEAVRMDRRYRVEEAVNKTAIKLLLPLVIFIFPPLMVMVIGPAVFRVIETFSSY